MASLSSFKFYLFCFKDLNVTILWQFLCFRWQVTWAWWHQMEATKMIPVLSLVTTPSASLWLADVMWHHDDPCPDTAHTVPVTSLGPQVSCHHHDKLTPHLIYLSQISEIHLTKATPCCCKLPNYFATEWKIICTVPLLSPKCCNWLAPFLVTLLQSTVSKLSSIQCPWCHLFTDFFLTFYNLQTGSPGGGDWAGRGLHQHPGEAGARPLPRGPPALCPGHSQEAAGET